jgi:hypothetical protein
MSATVGPREAGAATTAVPCRAPGRGAGTRVDGPCLGLVMANGRCCMHGGASTGPRTVVGLVRMVTAKITLRRYAVRAAPKWLRQRCVVTRIGLTAEVTLLRAYLPASMAARSDAPLGEPMAPKHPSQVVFEALSPLTPCNCLTPGLGRRARAARARRGMGGEVADGVPAAVQAPWRAAIAAARGLKRPVWEARRKTGELRNDLICGAAAGAAGQTRELRNDPIGGAAVRAAGQTRDPRNDPIGGVEVRSEARVRLWMCRGVDVTARDQAGETAGWAAVVSRLGRNVIFLTSTNRHRFVRADAAMITAERMFAAARPNMCALRAGEPWQAGRSR